MVAFVFPRMPFLAANLLILARYFIGTEAVAKSGFSCDAVDGEVQGGFQRLDYEGKYNNINYTVQCP